jgi:predicted O-methyltransferase YrrM
VKIRIVETIEELKRHFGLPCDGELLEPDLDIVEYDTEINGRKRRDAEVLCTLAANALDHVLELGTSHGRGAYKLATNLSHGLRCHSVNILPEQHDASGGKMVTHLITKEQIGSYYRERNVRNVEQHYANTARWEMPAHIRNLSVIFVDAAHDEENVYLDSKLVWDRLAPGGFIVWHDFSELYRHFDWIDASMRGVARFLREYGLDHLEVINLRHSWCGVLRKPMAAIKPVTSSVLQGASIVHTPRVELHEAAPAAAPKSAKSLRYVTVYPEYSAARRAEDELFASNARSLGYDVEAIGLPCEGGWWHFPKLDEKWRSKSADLMAMYDRLREKLRDKDVLIASGGPMLHPEFIRSLPTFNVWVCSDDPESSEILSKPAAPAFDFAFPINIACLDTYRSWGCRNVEWIFPPVRPELCAPDLTEEAILTGRREIDIALLCERVFNLSDRAQRIEELVRRFPNAFVRGPGWPGGAADAPPVYRAAKIGWNLHNSTGPCNTRTTMLPAFGVLQICDNKSNLGKIYELDREAVGFDSLEECVEKTRYYLAHDEERCRIAAAGWKRTLRDYTLERWWNRLTSLVAPAAATKLGKTSDVKVRTESAASNERLGELNSADVVDGLLDLPVVRPDGEKPRVLMLVDKRGWAYDTAAQAISKRLSDEFEFRIEYVRENPDLNAWKFDLLYVFFWGETYHQKFVSDPRRIIKEISSHRWANEDAYGRLTAEQAAQKFLSDAGTLTATSRRLQKTFAPYREVHWCPNGFEENTFASRSRRNGPLRIGWAGNQNDPCKGVQDILKPAAGDDFELVLAGGDLDSAAMGNFYNSVDVLCVASTAEGEPLTLVEGMAAGVFPVAVDVGIVPELVRHGQDGFVVNRSPAAFQAAFQWCRQNVDLVREAGANNALRLSTSRRWDDVAIHWRRALRAAFRNLPAENEAVSDSMPAFFQRNLGVNLGEWPERAQVAASAIAALPLPAGASLIDLGCGHQTLKSIIPKSLSYVPVDYIARAEGVRVMDFNRELPGDNHMVATFLGVLEYFADSPRLIRWAAGHVRYLVLSYNDCSNPARREKQHWKSTLGFPELESTITTAGGKILGKVDLGKAEFLYVAEFQNSPKTGSVQVVEKPVHVAARQKTIALLSAAVNGDNSGDALIVDAIRRVIGANTTREFPLLQTLSPVEIEQINSCDAAVICGTNLYQHDFHCELTPSVIERIRVPILPLGIGSSAPIGRLPSMNAEGIRAVRMIHERCAIGSVRDPVSLEFVRSIGVRNVELTGCPVLFHGLAEPSFKEPSTDRVFLSVRARLLHVEEHWNAKQMTTLRRLCRELRPTLILQSPYDIPIAEELVREFGLESLHDDNWLAAPMIRGVAEATRTVGFRLHFGMLSLAYGRPATFLATDTRTSGFCDMVGVPYHAVQTYRDEDLLAELRSPQPCVDRFLTNWRSLRGAMASLLTANGLEHALNPAA